MIRICITIGFSNDLEFITILVWKSCIELFSQICFYQQFNYSESFPKHSVYRFWDSPQTQLKSFYTFEFLCVSEKSDASFCNISANKPDQMREEESEISLTCTFYGAFPFVRKFSFAAFNSKNLNHLICRIIL